MSDPIKLNQISQQELINRLDSGAKDGVIDAAEWQAAGTVQIGDLVITVDSSLATILGNLKISKNGDSLDPEKAKKAVADGQTAADKELARKQLLEIVSNWKGQVAPTAKAETDAEVALKAKLGAPDAESKYDGKTLDQIKNMTEAELNGKAYKAEVQAFQKARAMAAFVKQQSEKFTLAYNESAGTSGNAAGSGASSGGSGVDMNGLAKAMLGGGSGTTQQAGSSAKATGSGYGFSVGTTTSNSLGSTTFSASSFAKAIFQDGINQDAMDTIGEAQKKQNLMLLFFYFAQMAMSGDINQMYQFLRFISYVICKDKALQNVWLGTQLIKLQEKSREINKEIMGDVGSDTDSQTKFTQKLQEVRSQENMIGTEQKLISQMMEEFTQVAEMLTNMQKSVLDVNGKVWSNLSVWR